MGDPSHHVVIAGGGLAALEALLALRHHAGDAVSITLLAAEREYVTRSMSIAEVFEQGTAERLPLDRVAADTGAMLVHGRLGGVDPAAHLATTEDGARLPYDTLVVATGTRAHRPLPETFTFGLDRPDEMRSLLLDLEEDYDDAVAFVVPPGVTWPIPAYELALLTVDRLRGSGRSPRVVIVTPEARPLVAFGADAGDEVERLLADARIDLRTGSHVHREDDGTLTVAPSGERLTGVRVVALPVLHGPAIDGLPGTPTGFLPTDTFGRVRGTEDVYAVGDAADWAVKHGSLAAEQADAAAEHIAARVVGGLEPTPFSPVLRGLLLTGPDRSFLRAVPTATGAESDRSAEMLWWPPAKLAARFLTPYATGEPGAQLRDLPVPEGAVPVEVALDE